MTRRSEYVLLTEGKITRREVWRAMRFPDEYLTHPLAQYEIRQSLQQKPHSFWIYAFVMSAIATAPLTYFIIGLEAAVRILLFWAGLYLVLERIRMMLVIVQKATHIITARKERGDWDLISITPLPKSRWLHLQFAAMIWQLWPLVRGLMVAQAIFMLVLIGFLGTVQHENWRNEARGDYVADADNRFLPPMAFVLLALPIGILTVLQIPFEAGLYAAGALNGSAESKESAFSMLRALFYFGLGRVTMTAVFLAITLTVMVVVGAVILLVLLGMSEAFIAVFFLALFVVFGTIGVYFLTIPILALVWEWLPLVGILALMIEMPYGVHVVISFTFIISMPFTYGFAPVETMRGFLMSGVHRLARRE